MACIKIVVGTLLALGKARDAVLETQSIKFFKSARQQLVGVALVTDVPDDTVLREMKAAVKRHRQLNNTQVRGKMSPVDRNYLDELLPDLGAQSGDLLLGDALDVLGRMNCGEVLILDHTNSVPIVP